ncbi:MAG: SpoIIIAH-like family protein [Clostridia bacterium]|nr:SpoIIIAH-like family protein [Clostridia bacterium]
MNRKKAMRALRFAGCAGLLALLAVSSYAGGRRIEAPAVPVLIETVSGEAAAAVTMETTRERLEKQRREALVLLESVLNDAACDETSRRQALQEKTKIASRMETEASVEALLAQMGFEGTAVVMGEGTLHIIAPWQMAENEQNRVRMIDAALSQSALSPDAVKIILAKK